MQGYDRVRFYMYKRRKPITQFEIKNILYRKQFIMTAVDRMSEEGLNSAKYFIVKKERRPLYTWFLVASNHTDPSYKNLKPVHGVYDWVVGKKM